MCQVDEDYREELGRPAGPSVSKKCVKCKEASASVVIRAGDAHCRSCFKENFVHKFRAMLGKTRLIFPGEKVLLAVSGGPSSCSMLSQVQEGLSQTAHKKLRFCPGIVYIDEGGAVGQSQEDRRRTVAELQAVFRDTGFPFHTVPLEQVLDLPSSVLATALSSPAEPARAYKAAVDQFIQTGSRTGASTGAAVPGPEPALAEVQESQTLLLQQLLGSVTTLTARQDLLSTLRQHLLVHTARSQGYSKLMLGDNCSRLAVKLLSSISLGRGAQLAQDTGYSDSRYGDIVSVRPMREYSSKEIAFYCRLFNVPSVSTPGLDTKAGEKASIQRLTESFVTRLQADFPSTVSTIYRTSEKLQVSCSSSSPAARRTCCLLCMCLLDTALGEASALQARLISEQLSQTKAAPPAAPGQDPGPGQPESVAPAGAGDCGRSAGSCCSSSGAGDCGSSSPAQGVETSDLRGLLCYSCQLTVRDMSSLQHLPQYVVSEARRRQRRSVMREEISEFLLDQDEDEASN
ncbi:cytoplasmic tRNA 2-thiolation protein 2 [Cololabis saira]|uniref:cytoplasmic tRNA 2-thiolation protein 2 n=1 Tax=Cololabis saira TaxID=129043 RepID=UPI002AD2B952|nr:cytoplasmic tRNA 2-thiolation protein 2 [Cololabis saira]XP_061601326.1 cytoplasmic tRNA 2-thiolation protein 2 [Cololabis saira]